MKVKIKTYNGELPYLTLEKEYEVIKHTQLGFYIKSDGCDSNIFCLFDDCDHLNGGSWEIVTESHTSHV